VAYAHRQGDDGSAANQQAGERNAGVRFGHGG
jgi:hypothetical protein